MYTSILLVDDHDEYVPTIINKQTSPKKQNKPTKVI